MATSSLTIAARTDQVRVARMVACAAARRIGLTDDAVEEVRLAVGEAVGRAVTRHAGALLDEPVTMRMTDSESGLVIEVEDRSGDSAQEDSALAMAVIRGLVGDARLQDRPDGTQVLHMSWAG
ncbi:MAG TPA: ATP-binding protein [Actinomycetota bacterium]|jgi:anti-sigma regulatory factor (Ser/Thr protein kinase)|nr:ATP-binding protein [Candidatus Nanopelagicales bacterium]HPE11387.1 ATP-binding protein [Actinomycetota bacterium]HPJ18093.1 ATP-binding protein [Actinomycetota bacterium]HPQ84210.1 ATP-binding protein [Actinomycetota bacterium]HRV65503.1 ATP-binding protein [Candidatus Nanopelagicales bacterium]